MKEIKNFIGMFVGFIIAAFYLVFKTDSSERFVIFGLGVVFCFAVYYFFALWHNEKW